MPKKYKVYVTETIGYVLTIEAMDEQEADDKAGEMIDEGTALGEGERMGIETSVREITK